MTKTQWLDAFRNIKNQLVSFLSVIVIAMLAVLIYLGINYAATAMDRNVSAYYYDRNAQDVQIISPLLLTEEDLQEICALEGVADAEGSNQASAWLRTEEQNYELSVLSLAERIAIPEILDGRAPQTAQECMLEQKLAEKIGLQVGDRIHLTGNAPDSNPLLMSENEFTITGLFSHPDHVTDNVSYNYYVIVTEEVFDQDTLEGNWLRVRVTLSDLPDNRFSKDYDKKVRAVEEKLQELSAERSPQRYEEVYETYEKKISDGEAELKDAKAQLEDADRQLQEAEEEILDAEEQIADGERQIADAEAQIADGEQQLRDGEVKIADGEQQIADSEQQIADGEAQIADAEAQIADAEAQIADYEQQLRDGEQQILDGEQQLRDSEQELLDGEQQLRDAEAQIADGEQQIADGEQKLRDGEQQIADGEAQIADAEAQIADYNQQIADGEQQIHEAEAQLRDAEEQIRDGERQLQEAEKTAAGSMEELEKGKAQLAEAERLLGLAPGQLADGEAKLRSAEEQLADGKAQLDDAREKLETAESYIYSGYDWMKENDYVPSPGDISMAKEIAEEFDVDTSSVPDEFPEDFLSWPEEKAIEWLKDNFGYSSQERHYRNELQRYRDGLEEYERGRNDYYYSGEQYLDGLTSYEKGKKAIEEAEAQLQQLYDARDLLEEKKQELEAGREELEAGREELEAGREELEAKKAELEAAKEELAAGKEELETGRAELEAKKEELEEGKRKLESGREELETGREKLEAGREELKAGREELEAKREELNAAKEELAEKKEELRAGKEELEAGKEELEAKREELRAGKEDLEAGREELEAGKKELEEKRAELLDAKQRIADARAELAEKKQEYEDGLQEYEDYRARLDNARDELSRLKESAWIVLNNGSDICCVFCKENSANLASLSGTFALLFIIIAALVIYASVGRMVDEQSVLVGTSKALGLYNREVLLKYMVFGVLGTLAGVLLGILLAWCLLQPLILHMYAPYYNTPEAPKSFLLIPTLIVVLGGLALSIIAVWIACSRLLKQTAKQLMSGENPVEKRKEKKSSSGSLYTRLIILNMTSDLKRVIVTIVSIAGCCMLLLIGFMLKNGQDGIPDKQYGGVQNYEAELRFDPSVESAQKELSGILDSLGMDYIAVCRGDRMFAYEENLSAATLVAAETDSLPGFYNLYDAKTGEALPLPEHGILIPLRFQEDYGVRQGAPITIYDDSMQQHETEIAGVFNAYCGRIFFMTQDVWREIFAERPVSNSFFVRLNGRDISELTRAVRDTEGFLTVSDSTAHRTKLEETSAALNVLVIVMIIIAGLMAFFILVNLSGSYMIHKQKELTIMRINGFTVKECTRYASTELIVTTIVGILVGLLIGAPLGYWIQTMMESTDIQLVRGADIWSILFSVLITALFSLIINGNALRKVKTLKLSDI